MKPIDLIIRKMKEISKICQSLFSWINVKSYVII
nr:MAG TPA: hypothetical protein [Caudoviricetes sp.]